MYNGEGRKQGSPIWIEYAKGPFSFEVKTSITTLSLIYFYPPLIFLLIFIVWRWIPSKGMVSSQKVNKPNYYGIAATLATVISLSSSAHLAYIAQPITAMLWMIPILLARPFAFGFQIYGWRRWVRKFDPAFFAMIFLNSSLGLGMGTGSVHGDQIARISFIVFAGVSSLLMLYIDVYQWKRRDEVTPADLYQRVRNLIKKLDKQSHRDWAGKFRDCLEGGATGTEIVMGLRWNAEQLIKSSAASDEDCRAEAALIQQEASRLVGDS